MLLVLFQMSKLLNKYKELLLAIPTVLLKLITSKDAPYFICIHYRTCVKLQLDLLYIFKSIEGYYDVSWFNIVELLSNSSLRSDNAALF